MWHKQLGHVKTWELSQTIVKNVIIGLSPLHTVRGTICGDCQVCRLSHTSHKQVPHTVSSHILELIHLDLMGLMQLENLGGERHMLVWVDDFSRFSWIFFFFLWEIRYFCCLSSSSPPTLAWKEFAYYSNPKYWSWEGV